MIIRIILIILIIISFVSFDRVDMEKCNVYKFEGSFLYEYSYELISLDDMIFRKR